MITYKFTNELYGAMVLKIVNNFENWQPDYMFGIRNCGNSFVAMVCPNKKFETLGGYQATFQTSDGAKNWLWMECEKVHYPIPVDLVL